jgi:hypothetical protein
MNRVLRTTSFALACALLAACGGGSGRTQPVPAAPQASSNPAAAGRNLTLASRTVVDHGLVLRQLQVVGDKAPASLTRSPLCTPPCAGALSISTTGPVQQSPTTYVVYWGFGSGADPSGEQSYLTSFLNGMGGSTYLNTLTQYYSEAEGYINNAPSQLIGTWVDTTNTVPATPSETDISDEAARASAHFGYAAEANYIVATPTGHNTPTFGVSGGYCGEHGSTTTGSGTIRYTYIGYQTDAGTHCPENWVNSGTGGLLDGVSIVAGHEVAETQTDPAVGSGWLDAGRNEMADKCAAASLSANVTLSTGTFAVQDLWSNAAAGCVLTTASATLNCTADSYGYCGFVRGGATTTAYCTIGHHTYTGISGDAWYHLYNNNSYSATNAGLYIESFSMDASCNQVTSWSPGEPSVVTGDPNLP